MGKSKAEEYAEKVRAAALIADQRPRFTAGNFCAHVMDDGDLFVNAAFLRKKDVLAFAKWLTYMYGDSDSVTGGSDEPK